MCPFRGRLRDDIFGLDIVVADLCRCRCPIIRVHPYSVKSDIPIWKCVWCKARRGRPTNTELALLRAWLREYGHTLEPLAFHDDGGVRFAYDVLGYRRGPVARLNKNRAANSAA